MSKCTFWKRSILRIKEKFPKLSQKQVDTKQQKPSNFPLFFHVSLKKCYFFPLTFFLLVFTLNHPIVNSYIAVMKVLFFTKRSQKFDHLIKQIIMNLGIVHQIGPQWWGGGGSPCSKPICLVQECPKTDFVFTRNTLLHT